jgi:hypothetical protein
MIFIIGLCRIAGHIDHGLRRHMAGDLGEVNDLPIHYRTSASGLLTVFNTHPRFKKPT